MGSNKSNIHNSTNKDDYCNKSELVPTYIKKYRPFLT